MPDPTISHGWTTSEPDAGKDVDAPNMNDHQITGFGAAVSAIVDPAVAAEATARGNADTAHAAASDPHPGYVTPVELAAYAQPVDSDLTAIAALSTTAFGRALLALADQAALLAAAGASASGHDHSATYQPLDSDLTAIAALTTTSYGRAFLALADAAAARTALSLGTAAVAATGDFDAAGAASTAQAAAIAAAASDATTKANNAQAAAIAASQPVDSDLTAIAALTTTSFGRGLLALADAAAGRTALGLGSAAVAATGDFDAAGAAAAAQAASQPLDSDLTAIAALSTTSIGRSILAAADAAALRTILALGTLATQSGTFSGTSSGINTGDQTLPTRVSLGLDTGDSPQLAAVNFGHASDTTVDRASAGDIEVEGNRIFRVGGADVPIADGGTGASTKAAAFDALSPMTTQDDLIIGGASGTGTRLGKGSDSQVLTVDPSTHHLVWATPSAGGSMATDALWDAAGDLAQGTGANTGAKLTIGAAKTRLGSTGSAAAWEAFSGCSLYNSTAQNVTHGSQDAISFDTEQYDTDSYHAGGDPTKITIPTTDYYRVTAILFWNSGGTSTTACYSTLFLNGSATIVGGQVIGVNLNADGGQCCLSMDLALTAADYLQVKFYNTTGTTRAVGHASTAAQRSFFQIRRLRG